MTKHELKQIYYLNKEIKSCQRQLDELNNKSQVGVPKLTGTPTGTKTRNKVEDDAIEKAELETIINGLLTKIQRQRREIMEYITTLDDSLIRQIMTCRYIHLMSWTATAAEVGGGNTADGVRKVLDRFFEKK